MESVVSLPPQELSQAILFWQLIGLAITLLGGVLAAVKIWDILRQKPPPRDLFATKVEVEAMEGRIVSDINELRTTWNADRDRLHERLDKIGGSLERGFSDIGRAMGRIEGAQDIARVLQEVGRDISAGIQAIGGRRRV